MTVSFGMLGILVMLDVCFVTNYFYVRALRRWTNSKLKREKQRQQLQQQRSKRAAAAASSQQSDNNNKPDDVFLSDVAFAWLLGSVKLDAMSVKKFPGYKAIPYKLGVISTSVFVILSCLVLAPDLVADQLGISQALTLNADLCVVEAFDAGLQNLKETLYNQTNLPMAKQQSELMTDFHQALINDTALYGVPPYQCPSRGPISGLKQDWNTNSGGSIDFFPGYCEQALESALKVAQGRECYHEVCDCPTLPDTTVFQMVGLADKKFCGEVCIPVPYACPPHVHEDPREREERLQLLDDYRYQQLETAEERRANLSSSSASQFNNMFNASTTIPDNVQSAATATADKVLHQVDIASYIYIAYSCIGLFFPSPLILFRMPYWISIKRLLFGVQKPYFICFVLCLWWGAEFLSQVYYAPEFRLFMHNLRLGDPCFIDANYLMSRQEILNDVCQELMPLQPAFDASLMTVTDVLREVTLFAESPCNCPFPNHYTSQLVTSLSSSSIYVTSLDDDNTEPTTASNWNLTAVSIMASMGFNKTMEFCGNNNNRDDNGQCTTLFVPDENVTCVGNSTICRNFTGSHQLVWESTIPEDAELHMDHWYELWLASGFLATLIVKFAVANFGLSLMELADPFVVCAGEFLWMAPPTTTTTSSSAVGSSRHISTSTRQMLEVFDEQGRTLPTEMVQTWFKTKQRSLITAGLSKTLFWGVLVHLCMLNLFLAVYQEVFPNMDADFTAAHVPSLNQLLEEIEERDRTVLAGCLTCSAFVILLGVYLIRQLNRLTSVEEEHIGDTDDSDFESDGENQVSHM